MSHSATLMPRPDAGTRPDTLSALPADLLEQIRSRVALLALLLFSAFAFDNGIHLVRWIMLEAGLHEHPEGFDPRPAHWISFIAMLMCGALWLTARQRSIAPARLHTLGLVFEVAICFVIALLTCWTHWLEFGMLPNLTWVPTVVVLFPLLLPGPPARMLVAACLAGATWPAAIAVLDAVGVVSATGEAYFRAALFSAFGVAFAWVGARIVYGLGRQVAAARELGSYVLEEKLGEGGMGEVWRARHRLLARPAAIKLIRSPQHAQDGAAATGDVRARFEREAQATAALRSPHTIDLYDFGTAADGTFYYVMELLDGVTADTLVRRFGPQPAARVIYLLRQLCHSLSEAEAHGLVHRDIKPANVFVCRYGEECDFVKVLDFGLVKTFGDRGVTSPALTLEHAVPGTPAYMAPEQARGGTVDNRADIYAAGCVAYWLLTGHTVFKAASPIGMVLQHTRTMPEAPSRRTELPVPPALDALVLDCLAKSPGDRPQTVRALIERLDAIETVGAIDSTGTWTAADARTWWDAHLPASAAGYGAASGVEA